MRTVRAILIFTAVGLTAGILYYELKMKKLADGNADNSIKTRDQAINIIVSRNVAIIPATLTVMDSGFLIEWAKALQNGKKEFAYNGKTFTTNNGKVK